MNFFEQQAHARRQSRWLIVAFAASVLAVAGLMMALMAVTFAVARAKNPALTDAQLPELPSLLGVGLTVLLVIGIASLYKIARLKSGGASIAMGLGATRVQPDAREARHRRLHNVVEEIAIASGVPVPQVFVLEQEPGINAFAAGYSTADAAVTVTRGALEKLTRDELQGVIAHEFSHILNGDMRVNIRLMGMVFGLLVVHIIGREILAHSPRGEKKGPTLALMGFGLMVLGLFGMLCARMMKAAISRQREYLADASAVQFTRQTDGLAGALKKVAGLNAGSRLQQTDGEEVSHMLFGEGFSQSALFATHPPVLERIRRLQPSFSPAELRLKSKAWNEPGFQVSEDDATISSFAPGASSSAPLAAQSVVDHVAHPGAQDYRQAEWLSASLPDNLRTKAEDPEAAVSLLLALLMSDASASDVALTQSCLASIASSLGQGRADAVAQLLGAANLLPKSQRLPLASLAFATLRRRSELELRLLQSVIIRLTLADGRVGPFQFALGHLLSVQLDDWFNPATTSKPGGLRLDAAQNAVAQLLTLLAEAGTSDAGIARKALEHGWAHLYSTRSTAPVLAADYAALDVALHQLDELVPFGKQALIEAMVQVLSFDGRSSIGEAELLRVVCASLHCPLPPVLGS